MNWIKTQQQRDREREGDSESKRNAMRGRKRTHRRLLLDIYEFCGLLLALLMLLHLLLCFFFVRFVWSVLLSLTLFVSVSIGLLLLFQFHRSFNVYSYIFSKHCSWQLAFRQLAYLSISTYAHLCDHVWVLMCVYMH